MSIAIARGKARDVLDKTSVELEKLKEELDTEFASLRASNQSGDEVRKTDDQVRALDNVLGAIKVARSELR